MTSVVGLLLAAGAGRRMGMPKSLVVGPDGQPWLHRSLRALRAGGCDRLVVVLGAEHDRATGLLRAAPDLDDVEVVLAADWDEGMGASLRAGLSALECDARHADDAVLVSLVDLPDVGADVVSRVLALVPGTASAVTHAEGAAGEVLGRAAYAGVPGHPVLLGRAHWAGVAAAATGDSGGRAYLSRHPVDLVECGDLASGADRDTPAPQGFSPTPVSDHRLVGDDRPMSSSIASAAELTEVLGRTGYLADEALSTIGFLALRLQRPLLLEGEPGTGKTALAEALAEALEIPLIRLQCYEGIDSTQALYDWDFPRQILHLRALETTARIAEGDNAAGGAPDTTDVEKSLFDERFLLARPVLQALRESPAVLLVDEIDRADDEFEAFLLEVLSTYQVSIPELGTVRAAVPPIVILTSNRTRELHDALKRRCLYHWIDHPGLARELEIVRSRAPEVGERLGEQVVAAVQAMRRGNDLVKPPGVAETLDWARALQELGASDLDVEHASATLGVAVKYREDADRVRASLDTILGG